VKRIGQTVISVLFTVKSQTLKACWATANSEPDQLHLAPDFTAEESFIKRF